VGDLTHLQSTGMNGVPAPAARCSSLYGVRIASEWPLPPGLAPPSAEPPEITIYASIPPALLDEVAEALRNQPPEEGGWYLQRPLAGGATYLCWTGLFEFVVSESGAHVYSRPLAGATDEAFHTYLLNQVLSFALLCRGVEPLHSTSVVVDGHAVAFLGDCGYGKSSLGAAFLAAGHRLLTDDLLVVDERPSGWVGHPGPSRMKLFPEMADHFFGPGAARVPMNGGTPKAVLRIPEAAMHRAPAPLAALVFLHPPGGAGDDVRLDRITPREAFIGLTTNTFNDLLRGPERLRHHLFWASRVSASVPVWRLSYPRDLAVVPRVVERVAQLAAG
jgi:hypothetical protein